MITSDCDSPSVTPPPFQPAPWWSCLFRRWEEPEFVQAVPFKQQYSGVTEWSRYTGSLYRQRNRRTGAYRYWVRSQFGDLSVDASAWERAQSLVFA